MDTIAIDKVAVISLAFWVSIGLFQMLMAKHQFRKWSALERFANEYSILTDLRSDYESQYNNGAVQTYLFE